MIYSFASSPSENPLLTYCVEKLPFQQIQAFPAEIRSNKNKELEPGLASKLVEISI
jgi:hypothetical protein